METLVERLRKRAEIRRQIPERKSVQEGKPDRVADLLDEAADQLERQQTALERIAYEVSMPSMRDIAREALNK